jgi:peptide/nickel transport system substrate-binding protein
MKIRALASLMLLAGLAGGCDGGGSGPIAVSMIGTSPKLANPNLQPLDPPSEALILLTAQGLVSFDAAGQIEPGLAQSWIVSDDGLRYTFRLRRATWGDGERVTAKHVAARLQAATSKASRNPLKPLLGVVSEILPMTDDVLEISLLSPRPAFLQLLAQPEMGISLGGSGTGPFHALPQAAGAMAIHPPPDEEREEDEVAAEDEHDTRFLLRGERAALAVARFASGAADFVSGGTVGDLPLARAATLPSDGLRFDPAAGLFGLTFAGNEGILADLEFRRALSMAIDRESLVAALQVPELAPRQTVVPAGLGDLPQPAVPQWGAASLADRRAFAARIVTALGPEEVRTLRVALPPSSGYRLIFAHLKRDWRAVGIRAELVPENDGRADLRLLDEVAPAELSSWYLRRFTCESSAICAGAADEALARARAEQNPAARRAALAEADRILTQLTPFIPLTAPVRWSLVSPRLTGFRPNAFARHNIAELVAGAR